MASVLRIDPLGAFNFYLTLIDSSDVVGTLFKAAFNYAVAGFNECSGLEVTHEVMEYREGGLNTFVHKFPTRAMHPNLVLRQGMVYLYDDLWKWHNDFLNGRAKRKDGTIAILDEAGDPVKVLKFKNGVPTKWIGPVLNAQQSQVAIEALEIAHEGLEMTVGV